MLLLGLGLYNWLLGAPQELDHLPVPQPLPLRKPTSQPPASAPTSSTHAQQAVLNQVFSDCIAAARMQPGTMYGDEKTGTNKNELEEGGIVAGALGLGMGSGRLESMV
ncbi:hypothetical protein HaLaN_29462 [Haematococcus lacustris]|uniref:Uncharacterized protein n=1 Tax=Haematococcus lacustris TaxID=44745 RepID=A0A6A0ACK4_HAELA|nr:hypothetical protein HaLaN_29462 [Haematococcus lacustris]